MTTRKPPGDETIRGLPGANARVEDSFVGREKVSLSDLKKPMAEAAPEASKGPWRERAFMLFLESLLQAEFGEALHADPGLPELAERVAAQLRADARLATLVEEVTDRLLAGPG